MRIWRMSMRWGNQGYEMWPQCFKHGVGAISYRPFAGVDLSQYPKDQPKSLWNELAPAQRGFLRKVAYEIAPGDIIYVKQGPQIVGKGLVTGPYRFQENCCIVCPGEEREPFAHQVPVDWEPDFVPVKILVGSEPSTVLELKGERLRRLEAAIGEGKKSAEKLAALEGKCFRAEITFRERNRALIEAKKANSDGRCEVCKFNFMEKYSELERDCLIAHHVMPIGRRRGSSGTTLDDIVLLCPNCHAAVHTNDPPITPAQLQAKLKKERQ